MKEFLARKILDNTVENYLWFLSIILVAYIIRKYLTGLIANVLYRFFRQFSNRSEVKKFNTLLLRPTNTFVVLLTIFFAFQLLKYPEHWKIHFYRYDLKILLNKIMEVILTISFTWMCLRMADFIAVIMRNRTSSGDSRREDQLVPFIKDIFKVFIVIFSGFFILGFIFKVNVASLITGLGIGGIAIALAAQDSLANLFASLTIFLDRPFLAGDVVKVGAITGTVERVGFRSTRIRTLDKTYVAVPNRKMVDDYLDNLSLRTYRRVTLTLALSLETKPEQLKKVISDINLFYKSKPILNEENIVAFDTISLHSLDLLVEYFIPTMEYADFLKQKEEINFRIIEIIRENGCEFAEPPHVMRKTN